MLLKREPFEREGMRNSSMSNALQQAKVPRVWECKQCHRPLTESETVAYHLVDRVLYGWCENCFKLRPVDRAA